MPQVVDAITKKINNFLLKPGEEFSMNLALGPRTMQNGYMQAPIILKDTMVQGTGGGVCQVVSTLYNSVLISRLKVTHRVNHSIPLGYVPPGQDATISEGYIDFKFQNNRDYTICVVSEVVDNTVTVKIIGRKRDDDPYVILKPVVLAEYDAPEPEYIIDNTLSNNETKIISEEKKGLRVILFRETYDIYGDLLNKEKISEDFYRPVRAKVAVNKDTYELIKK
jgi:vancomycin resistance protein YoaR